jgi:hypothetical protein
MRSSSDSDGSMSSASGRKTGNSDIVLSTPVRIEEPAYLNPSACIIPAASAKDARQLLQSTTADSFRIRYVSLSTFLFRCFQASSDEPHQFRVGQVLKVVVLPGVILTAKNQLDCVPVQSVTVHTAEPSDSRSTCRSGLPLRERGPLVHRVRPVLSTFHLNRRLGQQWARPLKLSCMLFSFDQVLTWVLTQKLGKSTRQSPSCSPQAAAVWHSRGPLHRSWPHVVRS